MERNGVTDDFSVINVVGRVDKSCEVKISAVEHIQVIELYYKLREYERTCKTGTVERWESSIRNRGSWTYAGKIWRSRSKLLNVN
jgi:hypothetical protein